MKFKCPKCGYRINKVLASDMGKKGGKAKGKSKARDPIMCSKYGKLGAKMKWGKILSK